jgi:ABC-type transport system involved in cytochrome bd biosynthesis fused ATPase/permease subunit
MVTQESFLFNGTIRENLLFGKPDARDEELLEATEAANARSFHRATAEWDLAASSASVGEIECRREATTRDRASPC